MKLFSPRTKDPLGRPMSKRTPDVQKFLGALGIFLLVASFFFSPVTLSNNFSLDEKIVLAQQESRAGTPQVTKEEFQGFDCLGGSIQGCIADVVYYLLFTPAAVVFALSGMFLDTILWTTLQPSLYENDFINVSWGVVRDIANLFFIVILLYAAVATILEISSVNTKKVIINTIIVALVVNFSLFFTKQAIFLSNGLANVFYSGFVGETPSIQTAGGAGPRQITERLAYSFSPQDIISPQIFRDIQEGGKDENDGALIGRMMVILLFSTGMFIMGTLVFLPIAILFTGRVATLWILMITAPVAFVGWIIGGSISKRWLDELVKSSSSIVIFLFLLYVLTRILEARPIAAFFSEGGSLTADMLRQGDFASFLVVMLLQFTVVMFFLQMIKKFTIESSSKMMSNVSEMYNKYIGGAAKYGAGAVAGAGIGASGFALRQTIGRAFAGMAEGLDKQGWAGGNLAQRLAFRGTRAIGKAGFDVREAPGVGKLESAAGIKLGAAEGRGGFAAWEKTKISETEKYAKEISPASQIAYEQTLKNMGFFQRLVTTHTTVTAQKSAEKVSTINVRESSKREREKRDMELLKELRAKLAELKQKETGGGESLSEADRRFIKEERERIDDKMAKLEQRLPAEKAASGREGEKKS